MFLLKGTVVVIYFLFLRCGLLDEVDKWDGGSFEAQVLLLFEVILQCSCMQLIIIIECRVTTLYKHLLMKLLLFVV